MCLQVGMGLNPEFRGIWSRPLVVGNPLIRLLGRAMASLVVARHELYYRLYGERCLAAFYGRAFFCILYVVSEILLNIDSIFLFFYNFVFTTLLRIAIFYMKFSLFERRK